MANFAPGSSPYMTAGRVVDAPTQAKVAETLRALVANGQISQASADAAIRQLGTGATGPSDWNAINLIDLILSGGAASSLAAKPRSLNDIVGDYKAGKYGPVGTPEAKQNAVHATAQWWESTSGLSPEDALARATANFNQTFNITDTPTKPDVTPPDVDPPPGDTGTQTPIGPGLNPGETTTSLATSQLWDELGQSPQGRQKLLEEANRARYPGASNPFQAFLTRRGDEQFNQYSLQSALGGTWGKPGPSGFRDFLRGGTTNMLSQDEMGSMLGRLGDVLARPDTKGLSDQLTAWLPFFRQGQNQFNTALQSSEANVPDAARPFFKNAASDAFQDYSVNNPETGGWLNWWLGNKRRFF